MNADTAALYIRDLERRIDAHIKGESCKHFCQSCTKPLWFVDDEDMTCRHCGHKGFPVPDIDAELLGKTMADCLDKMLGPDALHIKDDPNINKKDTPPMTNDQLKEIKDRWKTAPCKRHHGCTDVVTLDDIFVVCVRGDKPEVAEAIVREHNDARKALETE